MEEHVGSHVSLVLDRDYCSVSGLMRKDQNAILKKRQIYGRIAQEKMCYLNVKIRRTLLEKLEGSCVSGVSGSDN